MKVIIEVTLPQAAWYPGGESLWGFTQLYPINQMLATVIAAGHGYSARVRAVEADPSEWTSLGPMPDGNPPD